MFRLLSIHLVACLLFFRTGYSQNLPIQKPITNKWIKTWLLCGPIPLEPLTDPSKGWNHLGGYETDYLQSLGGETNIRVKAGDVVKFPNGTAKWTLHTTTDSVIDLRKTLTRNAPVFAYAYTEITADQDKAYFLSLGTNDGGSLWVNGVKVWDYPSERGLKIDSDVIPVSLKKGINKILLKVEQRGNRWEFCTRFQPFTSAKLAQRGDLFLIEAQENGQTLLKSQYTPSVLEQLVKSVAIKVVDSQNKEIINEQRSGNFYGDLKLTSDYYQSYTAYLNVVLKTGEKVAQKLDFKGGKRQEYSLFKDKKTAYRIAVSENASASELWAAKELQNWLKEASGADFPIQTISQSFNGPQIILGYNSVVKDKTGMIEPQNLDESYHYFNKGADIIIFGGKQRGTMYGVMAFLENELGCRWYTPTVTVVPKREELKFTLFGHTEKPGIRVRNDFYFEAFDPIWASRNKMNGSMSLPPQPGGVESYWSVHTFYPLLSPEEFFHSHPEYFSLLEGKRTHDHAQLCLSNPEVLSIITDRIKKRMRESPEYLIYDVSQNDWYNPCQCDKCQAIVKREGSESGIMIWFVNQIADAVKSEFPDKFIGTLAYQYTRNPPTSIRPRENVVVRFCSIECCFSHDFKSCPENQSFMKDLKKWSSLAPHLYIWDYVVNFSHYVMPYPNFAVLQSNIKTFQENNAIGIMEQASYQGRGGEFSELRAYLISKLLWNPDCNTEDVINDFIYGYYGRGGKFVRAYFDLLQNRVKPDTHIHLGLAPADYIFSDEFVRESQELFEEAKKVAENDEMVKRIEMASLPILYLKCKRTPILARNDGTYALFCKIAEREKVTHFSEAGQPQVDAFHHSVKNAR